MKRLAAILLILSFASAVLWAGGAKEAAGSASRGRYLAGQGVIIPPEEIHVDSYVAQIDYRYPDPVEQVGVTLYSGQRQLSNRGQEGVIHVGLQGARLSYENLSPMNLAFVIDKSDSMRDKDKIDWVKAAFDIFIERVRDVDFVSLVVFDDEIGILEKYITILGGDLKMEQDRIVGYTKEVEIAPPVSERSLNDHLTNLFTEMTLDLSAKASGTIAVSGFAKDDGSASGLTQLLNEMALAEMSRIQESTLLEREKIDEVLAEQELALSDLMDTSKAIRIGEFLAANYIVTGTVIEMVDSVIIFGRIINVESGEVESVAQVIIPKNKDVNQLI